MPLDERALKGRASKWTRACELYAGYRTGAKPCALVRVAMEAATAECPKCRDIFGFLRTFQAAKGDALADVCPYCREDINWENSKGDPPENVSVRRGHADAPPGAYTSAEWGIDFTTWLLTQGGREAVSVMDMVVVDGVSLRRAAEALGISKTSVARVLDALQNAWEGVGTRIEVSHVPNPSIEQGLRA